MGAPGIEIPVTGLNDTECQYTLTLESSRVIPNGVIIVVNPTFNEINPLKSTVNTFGFISILPQNAS